MCFGFQFNLNDSSDDDLYRLDLDPECQGHQWKMIAIKLGSYFGTLNKAYRPNAHLLYIVMHYNGSIV